MSCAGIARAGDRIADSVAGILPASIPRGAAKIGILSVGGLIAFSVLQKVNTNYMAPVLSALQSDRP